VAILEAALGAMERIDRTDFEALNALGFRAHRDEAKPRPDEANQPTA